MAGLVDRMQQALTAKNMSWSKAAVQAGFTAQASTKWKKGQISTETLEKFAKVTGSNIGWLITGKGTMHDGTWDNNVEPAPYPIKQAPVLNCVQAGKFTSIGSDSYDEYLPYFGDYGSDDVYWLKIQGDSMVTDFKEGEYVLINKDRQPSAGNYVAALKTGEETATFKKYRPKGFDESGVEYWHLVPSNPEFPIIDSRYEPFEVLGVAVERNQKLV